MSGPIGPSGTSGTSTVPATVTLTGTVQGLGAEEHAWLVVLDVQARRYYPERRALAVAGGGTWSARVTLGPKPAVSGAGTRFLVLLVVADARAATKLATYGVRRPGDSGSGLGRLPTGTSTLASVALLRA